MTKKRRTGAAKPTPREGQWARCAAGFYGLPGVSLVGSISDTHGFDLEAEGFVKMSTLDTQTPIPAPTSFCLNLSSRYDADVLHADDRIGTVLFGASFTDPHPDQWGNEIHERRRALVIIENMSEMIADLPPTLEKFKDRLSRMYAAAFPLMLRAWPDGLGSNHEKQ